jgi:regulator of protease activity HflC (stomatin/prohibitin superfamily)
MSDTAKILARGAAHILTGLGVQILISGILFWLTRAHPDGIARHVLWTSLAGGVVWLHLLVTYSFFKLELQQAVKVDTDADADSNAAAGKLDRIHLLHRTYQRVILPILELGAAALLIQSLLASLGGNAAAALAASENNLFLIALYSVATLFLIVLAVYLTSLMRVQSWHLLKSGRNYSILMSLLFFSLLAVAGCGHFRITGISAAAEWGLTAVNTVLAAEILFSMGIRLFAPRKPDALPRPAFDFYLLEGLARPMRIGQTFAAMLESIFGFDIAQTSFGKVVRSLVLPAICLTVTLLFGLSTIVIVQPYEQGIVLTLGCLKNQPLQPGIHFKLPWPLASAELYNVAEVRSLHVGSHKPARTGGRLYREGVPILWTNMHGLNIDELLICSSPQDMVDTAVAIEKTSPGAGKVPSVSLAAADVQVQFIIDDLVSYVRSSAMPELFLRKVAETFASQFMYRYDIDALFCEARLTLADTLRRFIQAICDENNLGVRIIHVAVTAVHPPVDVAAAFEETVAALQERETKIQQARQKAIQSQVEATGSTETFARLAALADRVDQGSGTDVTGHEHLLHACGGAVSQILAEAEAYRISRDTMERGKTERFGEQLQAHAASPQNYRYDQYLSVLEKGLAERRKVVLLGNTEKTIVRMGLQEGLRINTVPDPDAIGFQDQ